MSTDLEKIVLLCAFLAPTAIGAVFITREFIASESTWKALKHLRFYAPVVGAAGGVVLAGLLILPPSHVLYRITDLSTFAREVLTAKEVLTVGIAGLISLVIALAGFVGLRYLGGITHNAAMLALPVLASVVFMAIQFVTVNAPPTPTLLVSGQGGPTIEKVASRFDFISSLTSDSKGRLIATEFQTGRVWLLQPNNGSFKKRLFATVPLPDGIISEQGLWHAALSPDETYLYVVAIASTGESSSSRIVRFPYNDGDGGPMEEVLTGLPASEAHSGGAMTFGPDGNLYLSIGDVNRVAQAREPSALEGSILRLLPDGRTPEDNPIPGSPVYAYGFRNPYGIAFHPRSGLLYATDNGSHCCDRLVPVERGGFHGYPDYFNSAGDIPKMRGDPDVVAALLESGTSTYVPTELIVYDGDRYGEEFKGNLFFTTFGGGDIHRVVLSPGGLEVISDEIIIDFDLHNPLIGITTAPDGYIYFSSPGEVYRVSSLGSSN